MSGKDDIDECIFAQQLTNFYITTYYGKIEALGESSAGYLLVSISFRD